MNDMPIDVTLRDELFEELGLDLLPEDEREEVIRKIGEVIFEGVMFRTVQALSDPLKEELTALFDASTADPDNVDKQAAIQAFIETHVPEFDSYLHAELEALKHAPQDILTDQG